jgi:Fumarate reductase subunit C
MIKKNNDNYPANNNLSIKNGNQSELTPLPAKQRLFLSIIDKLTAFSMIWVSMVLMYGVICMYTNAMGQDEFYRFIFFLQSPLAVIINVIALLLALFHSINWFRLIAKVVFKQTTHKKEWVYLLVIGLCVVTLLLSYCLLLSIIK